MRVDFSRVTEAISKLQYSIDEQRKTFYGDWEDKVHDSFERFVRQNTESKNELQEIKYQLRDISSALAELESAQSYRTRIDNLLCVINGINV